MILIQTMKWLGPSRRATDPKMAIIHEPETFATRRGLSEALAALREYSRKFERVYGQHTAVEHTVIGIQYLNDDLSAEDLANANLALVEEMGQSLDEELEDMRRKGPPR